MGEVGIRNIAGEFTGKLKVNDFNEVTCALGGFFSIFRALF